MTITPLHTVVQYKDKHALVKALIYLRLLEKGIHLPDNVLNVLALFGVYSDKDKVIEQALSHKFYNSAQTVDNVISALVVKTKLLQKLGDKTRKIDPEILPAVDTEYIAATYKIHNIQAN